VNGCGRNWTVSVHVETEKTIGRTKKEIQKEEKGSRHIRGKDEVSGRKMKNGGAVLESKGEGEIPFRGKAKKNLSWSLTRRKKGTKPGGCRGGCPRITPTGWQTKSRPIINTGSTWPGRYRTSKNVKGETWKKITKKRRNLADLEVFGGEGCPQPASITAAGKRSGFKARVFRRRGKRETGYTGPFATTPKGGVRRDPTVEG